MHWHETLNCTQVDRLYGLLKGPKPILKLCPSAPFVIALHLCLSDACCHGWHLCERFPHCFLVLMPYKKKRKSASGAVCCPFMHVWFTWCWHDLDQRLIWSCTQVPTSKLPPLEAPVMIAEKRKLFFSFLKFLPMSIPSKLSAAVDTDILWDQGLP